MSTLPKHRNVIFAEVSRKREHWLVAAILSASAALLIAFSLGPISESPDEFSHYTFIRHLISTQSLPDPVERPFIQAHQAPLYYVLGIPFVLAVDSEDVQPPAKNPWGGYHIDAVGNDNKNIRLHTQAESFPYEYSRVARALHITRLLSILMGTGTVIACYAVFRILWPANPATRLTALGIVAFWPQLSWLSSVINNDNLLNLMSTLVLLALLHFQSKALTWNGAVTIGVLLGLALLSKASAVFLFIPVGAAAILDRGAWKQWTVVIGLALAIGAWWYVRNLMTIGTLSGWPDGQEHGGLGPNQSLIAVAWDRMPFVYNGFWARFGQVDVPVSPIIYRFFDALLLVSLVGTSWWMWLKLRGRRILDVVSDRASQPAVLLTVFGVAWLAGVYYSSGVVSQGNQGRYVLPGVAAWGAIMACGLQSLIPARLSMRSAISTNVIMASVTLICLFGFFYPAYRPLKLPAEVEHPLSFQFGDSAKLIGISPLRPRVSPGETITVSLYWQALRSVKQNLVVYLHTVGSELVRRDSYPGTGNLLSADWTASQTWEERYVITIPRQAERQTSYDLIVGLYDYDTRVALPVTDFDGNSVEPVVGRIVVGGEPQLLETTYQFGQEIALGEPTLSQTGDHVKLCLQWKSLAPTSIDYRVFVHLVSAGTILAQTDYQPRSGLYPTSLWSPGEVVQECVTVDATDLPLSGWQVNVGLYDFASGARLPVIDSAGQALADNQVVIHP